MDTATWEIEFQEKLEASFSPGLEEEGCDWSGEEAEIGVVEARPAYAKVEQEEDDPMGGIGTSGTKEEPSKGDAEAGAASSSSAVKPDESLDPGFVKRTARKVLRFGSAQIRLLQEIAMADAANWADLQKCIKEQEEAGPKAKAQLLKQLNVLADIKAESRDGAIEAWEEHKKQAVDVSVLEAQYKDALSEEAKRLERYNPVGPRSSHQLITTNRLNADIAAGMGIWQATRDHRARERAARHRQAMRAQSGAPAGSAGSLVDVPTEAHAKLST